MTPRTRFNRLLLVVVAANVVTVAFHYLELVA
jgi:hypothetical protein